MNRTTQRILLSAIVLVAVSAFAQEGQSPATQRVRIGVDIRLGFQASIDSWTPIAEYLSKSIDGCRFVIVPLASEQDLIHVLKKGDIDFMVLGPALALLAEDRFDASPLATMIESQPDESTARQPDATCSGTMVCRADRADIKTLANLRGQRLSAVKPWSLTGWIAQWALLKGKGIDPQRDLAQVVFEGTHGQVAKSVLSGSADVGALDADLLLSMLKNHVIPEGSLRIINRQGVAVPLSLNENAAATELYPGRMFAKSAATSDELAKKVANALMNHTMDTKSDGMSSRISWTVPANYSKVRRTLYSLMGERFAYSPGFPLPRQYPAWIAPVLMIASIAAVAALIIVVLRGRHRRHERMMEESLETARRELAEVWAGKRRIDTILALAGCGIDIVDDNDDMIYADTGIERQYGDWRGKKCYAYFCGSDSPCPCCNRPGPLDGQEKAIQSVDCSMWSADADLRDKVPSAESESMQMIGVPFHDESGKWLYARIHFPVSTTVATT